MCKILIVNIKVLFMTSEKKPLKTIINSKLIKLLSSFSTLEWKRFGRFVQSPYHNTNSQLIKLYEVLKKAFPFDKLKTLEQERVYKKVYGAVPFKLTTFQNLCSDLYGLATDFIIDVHLQKQKQRKEKILIDALSNRNYELFKGASQQLIQAINTQTYFLGSEDYLFLFQLNLGLHNHIDFDKFSPNLPALEAAELNLNKFTESIQAQIEAEQFSRVNILNDSLNPKELHKTPISCLLYTSPSPRDRTRSRMPSSA